MGREDKQEKQHFYVTSLLKLHTLVVYYHAHCSSFISGLSADMGVIVTS